MAAAVVGGGLKLAGIEIPFISSILRQVALFLVGFGTLLSNRSVRTSLGLLWKRQALVVVAVAIVGVLAGVEGTLWFQTVADSKAKRAERTAQQAEARATADEQRLQQVLGGEGFGPTPSPDSTLMSPSAQPSTPQQYLAQLSPIEGGDNPSVTTGTWTMNLKPYDHSIGISGACGTIGYNINRNYRLFQATVGMTDDAPSGTRLQFGVFIDGTQVAHQNVELGSPQPIQATVTNGLRLRLEVQPASGVPCSTVGVWGQARLYP